MIRALSRYAVYGVILCGLACPPAAMAQDYKFESATLDNGLQIVVIPNRRMPILTHMVWYKVGAIDEINGKSGLAHFLEHLMFKGTPDVPAGEFSRRVAEIGGNENAMTTTDYTAYYQTIAKENLPLVMELESDRMQNLLLGEKDFVSEKSVILEERKSRVDNNPGSILGEEIQAAMYRNHPYGRPLIGWEHEIRDLTHADVMAFHEKFYAPNNAIVVISGDAALSEILPMAEKFYGAVAAKKLAERAIPSEPEQRAQRTVIYQSAKVKQNQFVRHIYVPSFYSTDQAGRKTVFALQVLSEIFGGRAGILYKNLVLDKKIALGVSAYYDSDKIGPGAFGISATPANGVDSTVLGNAIDTAIADFIAKGVAANDLIRAKKSMVAQAIYARDNNFRMAYVVGETLAQGGTLQDIENWENDINAVSESDIAAAAAILTGKTGMVDGWLTAQTPNADQAGKNP